MTARTRRFRGIYKAPSGRWHVSLEIKGRKVAVGGCVAAVDAAVAADRLILHYRGRDWPRNFPRRSLRPAPEEQLKLELRELARTDPRYAQARESATRRNDSPALRKEGYPRGVFHDPRCSGHPFHALFTISDVSHHLGNWRTIAEASLARDRAALHFYGPDYPWFNDRDAAIRSGPADPVTLTAAAGAAFKTRTTSRFRGVHWQRGAWNVAFSEGGASRYLGRFQDEEEAARVWDRVAFKARGARARLNFHPRTGEELGGLCRFCDL